MSRLRLCVNGSLREQTKKENTQRIRDVEHGVFTPLVFTTTGGMGREAIIFYRRLTDRISTKELKEYSVVTGWI